jgi:preprotein translocase subunit SecE
LPVTEFFGTTEFCACFITKVQDRVETQSLKEFLMAKNKVKGKSSEKSKSKSKRGRRPTARRQPNAIQRFIKETIGELRKVSWPTRKEATNLTLVVLIVTVGMSAFLGFLDFIFSRFFALLIG